MLWPDLITQISFLPIMHFESKVTSHTNLQSISSFFFHQGSMIIAVLYTCKQSLDSWTSSFVTVENFMGTLSDYKV